MIGRTEAEIMSRWQNECEPKVSICCITFNQESYICEALDSFLSQDTTFPFEIIIRDDCSSDGTKAIIEKYAEAYPQIIIPIYETQNQYSLGVKPTSIVTNMARGKYIALCEGDDYWTDVSKIQLQFNFMESHPQVSLLFQNAEIFEYDKDSQLINCRPFNVSRSSGLVEPREILANWIIPTATVLFRNRDLSEFYKEISSLPVGDTPLFLYLAKWGNIHYEDATTSVYRILPTGIYKSKLHTLDSAKSFVNYYDQLELLYPELGLKKTIRKLKSIQHAWVLRLLLIQKEFQEAFRYLIKLLLQNPLALFLIVGYVGGRLLTNLISHGKLRHSK